MVSSINNTGLASIKQVITEMYLKMKAADTDGTNGLSKNELGSIDSGNSVVGKAFLDALQEQFDKIDADENGQISENDMKIAVLNQITNNSNVESSNNFGDMLCDFSKSLAKNLLNNYKDNV